MIAKNRHVKKGNADQIVFSVFLGILVFGITGFLLVSNIRIENKRRQLLDQLQALRSQTQTLEAQNAILEKGISQASTSDYWEAKAREQGYKLPGEQQVTILPPEANQASSTPNSGNIWQKLIKKIGL